LIFRILCAALLAAGFVPPALAQAGKVTRIVVPFAAGGAREVLARTFYAELGAALGQTIIVENRPGAGGAIGTASVAKAAPDGTTLVFAASSHNVTALLSERPAYDPIKDFAAVANVGMQSYVLMTSAQVPARSVAEFVAYARANPGKLNYSSPGHGSSGHLAMAYFARLAVDAGRDHRRAGRPLARADRAQCGCFEGSADSPARRHVFPPLLFPARRTAHRTGASRLCLRIVVRPARTGRHAADGDRAHQCRDGQATREPDHPRAPDAFAKLIAEDHEAMAKVVKIVGKVE
jgi:hypothetical protein